MKYNLITVHTMQGKAIHRLNVDFPSLKAIKAFIRVSGYKHYYNKVQVSAYTENGQSKTFNMMVR